MWVEDVLILDRQPTCLYTDSSKGPTLSPKDVSSTTARASATIQQLSQQRHSVIGSRYENRTRVMP
jgi:hypothetical protein